MGVVTICSDFEAQENNICHCFHCFPSICHEVMGPDAMIFILWMLNYKPAFSLSSFTFIKRLFISSLLSAIRVVSSAYLRLLIFLPVILIPDCDSSSPAFCLVYSSYRGFPDGASDKEPACQCKRCKRHWFDPWVGKIPWRRAWQPTSVFLPGESHWQKNLEGYSP